MKKMLLIAIALFVCGQSTLLAQETEPDSSLSTLSEKEILALIAKHTMSEENYKMYPTENMWTFLKLDTRTGEIWQMQYSVDGDDRIQVVVNDTDLTFGANEKAGRFELYPTQNMYNFLLLDKSTGMVVQIQWSMKAENRGVVGVIS